ncbi:FAD-dependent oxidoreductase [Peptostreptococcus equinus]|uniref:FAD-dependent oxidoreductase n=1 Tax=Peptostreptococcus equinus TaxID=3003601 RepID=A0ABY7JSN4_9FIRM|nr:FAD-dependent oxidoreductase [Peptostreptococcus sp. CBA3647]WAW14722.1 FAD-dependent oxidoreductase [Peptostreptococcus sp. CBA3647]
MREYKNVIIGFGKAGKTLASYLSKKGEKTALIEKSSNMYGGTCINVACIPSKYLEYNARLSNKIEDDFAQKSKRYEEVINNKNEFISALRNKNYNKVKDSGVDIIDGKASFKDKNTLRIESKDGNIEEIFAERIFINTGAKTVIPNIEGVGENKFVYTSDTMMQLKELPKEFVIIGGGYIGLEFASYYNNFGSNVTVIQVEDEFIHREDREIAQSVEDTFNEKGIRIIKSAKTKSIKENANDATIVYEVDGKIEEINADAVLLATGRVPNIDSLEIENAGIKKTDRGGIQVDTHLNTNIDNIWAMGDVRGGMQFTYISLDDFRIIKSTLEGGDRTSENRGNIPYTVFIDPPLSRVGMSEEQAKSKGYNIKVFKLNAKEIPKAHILDQAIGMQKIIVDKDTNNILGAHLFSTQSEELINLVKLAMDLKTDYRVLANSIYTHPTMSESLNDLLAE